MKNIFKTHFKEFSQLAKKNTKYTNQRKPIISRTDSDFHDTNWDSGKIYIFLDIDGVLNTSDQWKRMYQLDKKCVSRFTEYAKALQGAVRIILTSSWKNGFDPTGKHTPQIQALIDSLASHGIRIVGKTLNREDGDRAQEINDFIVAHKLEKARCIVVDDDPDIFHATLLKNCETVWTDARTGFM